MFEILQFMSIILLYYILKNREFKPILRKNFLVQILYFYTHAKFR